MVTRKILFRILIIIIPLLLGVIFSLTIDQKRGVLEGVSATVLPEAKALPAFVLEDHLGNKFTNETMKGQWSFVFFGFTHCPDICPSTLAILNQVSEVLIKQTGAELPKIIFISVDPNRDTKEILADYVSYFNPEFIGVTGELQALQDLTQSLGIAFGIEGDEESEVYEVFHSARIMLIDPEVKFKALFSMPHDAGVIASDYIKISNL
jgi:protein SCO1/2